MDISGMAKMWTGIHNFTKIRHLADPELLEPTNLLFYEYLYGKLANFNAQYANVVGISVRVFKPQLGHYAHATENRPRPT